MTWRPDDHPRRGGTGRVVPKSRRESDVHLDADPVERLIAERRLECTGPNLEAAVATIEGARRCLASAELLAETDPDSSVALSWDAARRAISAVMTREGLRPTKAGGHRAVLIYMQERIAESLPAELTSAMWDLRARRNATEYADLDPASSLPVRMTSDLAKRAASDARALLECVVGHLAKGS